MAMLADVECVECSAGDKPMRADDIERLAPHVPDWRLVEEEGVRKIRRVYKLKDFSAALDFTQKVGLLAEEVGHHPAILTEWGQVAVTWWTHEVRGLHENDFIMAAKCDRIFQEMN